MLKKLSELLKDLSELRKDLSELLKDLSGDYWCAPIIETLQDAIASYFILSIGTLAGRLISEKALPGSNFSSFNECVKEFQTDPYSFIPYVCYGLVALSYSLWAVVIGRLLVRSIFSICSICKDLNSLRVNTVKSHKKTIENSQDGDRDHDQ